MKTESYVALILALAALFVLFMGYKMLNQTNERLYALYEDYRKTVEENEMLWNYIDNVDTFKSLDDAVMYRDSLICELQFLDE